MNLNRLPILSALAIIILSLTIHAASASWTEQLLYSFQGGTSDGAAPAGGVVFDKGGNLYGALTLAGGANCSPLGYECGLVFQLSPPAKKGDPWTETILYQFLGKPANDGESPAGGVIIDSAGNLYGTTAYGGTGDCVLLGVSAGCGIVYELSPPQQKGGQWTETILYSFQSGSDGYFPWGSLTFDAKGNLYGATQYGGGKGTSCDIFFQYCGTVFKMNPPKKKGGNWTEKVLHSFAGMTNGKQMGDGANPNGGLIFDRRGEIYGTSVFGGYDGGECAKVGCGTVFQLVPPAKKGGRWTETILHKFRGQDGAEPDSGVIFGKDGNLYGSASGGGPHGYGMLFELAKAKGKSRMWTETVLYLFNGTDGGAQPVGGLVFDASGYLYGTTHWGHGAEQGGSVFQLKPQKGGTWTLYYLHGFVGATDGFLPAASLIFDKYDNLYSTTPEGGSNTCNCGTVFEVSP